MAESMNPLAQVPEQPEPDFNWDEDNSPKSVPMFPKDFEDYDEPTGNRPSFDMLQAAIAQSDNDRALREHEISIAAKMNSISLAANLDSVTTADELIEAAQKIYNWALSND